MRPTLRSTRRQRGAALIITVGILAVLAVVGFGFAVLARLHYDISASYRASAQCDLIAEAALQYAIYEIRYGWGHAPINQTPGAFRTYQTGAIADPTDGPNDPWSVDPTIAAQGYPIYDATTTTKWSRHYCNLRCNSYAVVHNELGGRFGVSNVKVLDCAGKLNLNDREDTDSTRLKAILGHLFQKVLALVPADATTLANNIVAYRDTLSGKRFSTLDELAARNTDGSYKISGMDARVFELLKHYVTIYSWPHDLPVANSFPYVVNPTASALTRKDSDQSTAKYYYRSPININTAGKELLYALLRVIQAADGTMLTPDEARDVALWIVRKRDPESTDHWFWPPDMGMSADWKAWVVPLQNPSYDLSLQRKFDGWSMYPVGQFNSWNEVIDFVYSLAGRTADHPHKGGTALNDDPFPDTLFTASADKKAEAIIPALSPNVFAAELAGYNAWHFGGFSRVKKDQAWPDFREQLPRDRDTTTLKLEPQVTGMNKLATTGNSYPLCFSSMGRHEIYSRTYTFLKADSGTVAPFTSAERNGAPYQNYMNLLRDTSKSWFSSPCQWRGYTVVIYEGTGKGQMRGIVFVLDDGSAGDGKGSTLATARWSIEPDGTSKYYIVGPGAFFDQPPQTGISAPTPYQIRDVSTDSSSKPKANWEDDQWNGHRVVVYRGTVSSGVETVDEASIQERTIIDTDKATKSLIVAPDLDLTIPAYSDTTKSTGYIILGCDGVVEHSGALKAYDVVHHTTQKDFEDSRPAAVSDAQYTYAATGPVRFRKADGSQVGAAVVPSRIDGWLGAGKLLAVAPTGASNPMVHNFVTGDLTPDSGGICIASDPIATEIVQDCLSNTNGRFLSDGIHLTGGAVRYLDLRLSSDLSTNDRNEGGFVSFWIRPDEAFFSTGTRTLVKIYGQTASQEEISLVVTDGTGGNSGKRVLELRATFTTARNYEQPITDSNHLPAIATPVQYKTGTSSHQDTAYSVIYDPVSTTGWRPGEWHHVAFAWHECANDGENHNGEFPAYNTDNNPNTDWKDDDTSGTGGKPDYILDDEVACRLRIWADGNSSAITKAANEKPAFNFYAPAAGTAMVRLSGEAAATIDGLVVFKHTDNQLNFTLAPLPPRYDGCATPPALATAKCSEYISPPITITNEGNELLTLGTISFTGFFPWIKDTERWGGLSNSTQYFPIRVQAALGGTWSRDIPRKGDPLDDPAPDPRYGYPSVLGGGPLVKTDKSLITSTAASTTVQYKVLLQTGHGSDPGDNKPGLLKGRQTPVVEDVTVTYLGAVMFYYWK